MPQTRVILIDAFTDRPFSGNPAAVCLLNEPRDEAWMQDFAAEMNLSETAFVVQEGSGFGLRWFTPKVEVDLCGHATLATAHALWEEGEVAKDNAIQFETKSGRLECKRVADGIELDFPAVTTEEITPTAELLGALGLSDAIYVGVARHDRIVVLSSEQEVISLRPDFKALAGTSARGVIVTSASERPAYDFVSRFFAPAAGINEDPVTGSAHCCLGPYWAKVLGKENLLAHQASVRGGRVGVRVLGDRVLLRGQAVTVLRGSLANV